MEGVKRRELDGSGHRGAMVFLFNAKAQRAQRRKEIAILKPFVGHDNSFIAD
jgi:hypothetical protein